MSRQLPASDRQGKIVCTGPMWSVGRHSSSAWSRSVGRVCLANITRWWGPNASTAIRLLMFSLKMLSLWRVEKW